jgi:hypothetical protein
MNTLLGDIRNELGLLYKSPGFAVPVPCNPPAWRLET